MRDGFMEVVCARDLESTDFKTPLRGGLKLVPPRDIAAWFTPDHHLRHVDEIFQRVFGRS